MFESSNIALIRRWIAGAWNQRDDTVVRELLNPSSVGHLEGLTAKGIEGFLSARKFLVDAFPDFHLTIDDAMAQGQAVAIRWSATGTHRGTFMGVAATGTAVSFPGITWFTVIDGQIVEGWDSWNVGDVAFRLSGGKRKS